MPERHGGKRVLLGRARLERKLRVVDTGHQRLQELIDWALPSQERHVLLLLGVLD